jgi:lysophospholipase L1-like esterase
VKNMVAVRRIGAAVFAVLVATVLAASVHGQSLPPAEKEFPGKVRLALAKVIYAVAGVETNIYFDNVILTTNSANYVFDVRCEKGFLFADRWTYTAGPEEQGAFPLFLEVRDDSNGIVARAQATILVVRGSAGAELPVTLLAVGDSLTQASVYTQRLLDLSDGPDGPSLRLIGSRGPGDSPAHGANRHEGYSGWSAEAFATYSGPLSRTGYVKGAQTGSPFVYIENGAKRLDFAKYSLQFNAGKAPDFVTFALGSNDIAYGTDENIDATIDRMLAHLDELVEMVHRFNRTTRVGVLLTIPPSSSQDGFWNYRAPQREVRWQYRRNQHRLIERMIEHYGGRDQENLYLVPTYLDLDAAHNFVTNSAPWNAQTSVESARVIDGIHPAAGGYRQMGDMIYAWIKACMADKFR